MTTLKPIEAATNYEITIETREVYIVRGANKAYLSEKGALNKLAYVRAQDQFNKEDRKSNFPAKKVRQEDGITALELGKMRPEFIKRHAQVLEELKADVKQAREIARLKKECKKAKEKLLTVLDDLENAEYKYRNSK
jgi:molecular chaperone GrpE (heat shock protein)